MARFTANLEGAFEKMLAGEDLGRQLRRKRSRKAL
jgi:hypothetical protein